LKSDNKETVFYGEEFKKEKKAEGIVRKKENKFKKDMVA
jgi:hypothetical protein